MRPWGRRENKIGNLAFTKLSRYIRVNSVTCYKVIYILWGKYIEQGNQTWGSQGTVVLAN